MSAKLMGRLTTIIFSPASLKHLLFSPAVHCELAALPNSGAAYVSVHAVPQRAWQCRRAMMPFLFLSAASEKYVWLRKLQHYSWNSSTRTDNAMRRTLDISHLMNLRIMPRGAGREPEAACIAQTWWDGLVSRNAQGVLMKAHKKCAKMLCRQLVWKCFDALQQWGGGRGGSHAARGELELRIFAEGSVPREPGPTEAVVLPGPDSHRR